MFFSISAGISWPVSESFEIQLLLSAAGLNARLSALALGGQVDCTARSLRSGPKQDASRSPIIFKTDSSAKCQWSPAVTSSRVCSRLLSARSLQDVPKIEWAQLQDCPHKCGEWSSFHETRAISGLCCPVTTRDIEPGLSGDRAPPAQAIQDQAGSNQRIARKAAERSS
jgi:hypothetical protein